MLSKKQEKTQLTRKERRIISKIIEKYKSKNTKEKTAQDSIPFQRIYP